MAEKHIRILLVEDDEDDYILLKSILSEIKSPEFRLKWVRTYENALEEMCSDRFDACLVDYRLGDLSGVELLMDAKEKGMKMPALLLTGYGDHDLDVEAMKAGAADYLEKGQVTPALLERSLRYALEHARTNQVLQELSRKVLSAQEDERKYIAKELHDSIGSSLAAIKFSLERKLDAMQAKKGKSDNILLEDIIFMVQAAIRETKRMQKALRPPILDDLGIILALRSLSREFKAINPSIEIDAVFRVEEEHIPERLKIVIYRIAQEALNNIAKHSRAHQVRVALSVIKDQLELVIEDNGAGFDFREVINNGSSLKGLGITSMKERAQYSGGTFSLISSKGKGTTIRVSWAAGNPVHPIVSL